MILSLSVAIMTASADTNDTKVIWDFEDYITEDIFLSEEEGLLFAYEPWNIGYLEIEDGKLVINHMTQDWLCNSLDLAMNLYLEDLSAYKAVAFWIDTSELDRAFTVKISIIDYAMNFISISADAPYSLYYDNGERVDLLAIGDDPNWIFLTLPEGFKGYIKMSFESMKCLNWNADSKKDIDNTILSSPFRMLLEFNNALNGEVTRIDDIQLIKNGAPEGWEGEDIPIETPSEDPSEEPSEAPSEESSEASSKKPDGSLSKDSSKIEESTEDEKSTKTSSD